ncbi:MAG: hypothetical protein K6E51_02815 [Treponema sp.]|nr:hypothetical protein [Treponema sp.]
MGCDISESYYFAGSLDGIKTFYDFLKPLERNTAFENDTDFETLINEKYPVDKAKLNDTSFGFDMIVGKIKTANKLSAFPCSLFNRNSISAYVFKELLDTYFPGVYMYFSYTGDSVLFNTCNTNDKEQRFFAHGEQGKCYLSGNYNELKVLHDGNYTRQEIIDSYVLFLGNPDIDAEYIPVFCGEDALGEEQYNIEAIYAQNTGIPEPTVTDCHALCENPPALDVPHGLTPEWQSKKQRVLDYQTYPELKACKHLVGQHEDGLPYLYRTVIYENPVRIPSCLTDFDKNAFDWNVLYVSKCINNITDPLTLVLTKEQAQLLEAKISVTKNQNYRFADFFDVVKTEDGDILFEYKPIERPNSLSAELSDDGFPSDIPF